MNALHFLSWFLVIGLKVWADWYQIKKLKKSPRHGAEVLVVIFISIILAGTFGKVKAPDFRTFATFLFYLTSYWFFFDGLLSWTRGLHWFYIGKTALTDRIFQKAHNFYRWSKYIAGILMIVSAIWIIQNQTKLY